MATQLKEIADLLVKLNVSFDQTKKSDEKQAAKPDKSSNVAKLAANISPDLAEAGKSLYGMYSGEGPSFGSVAGKGLQAGAGSLLEGGSIGEAAGAASEAAAGAAGGPVGLAIMATVEIGKLGIEIAKMPGKVKDWAGALLDSQKNLADFSSAMAAVVAKREVFEMGQKQRTGEATANSAGNLEASYEALSASLEPITNLLTNLENNGVALISDLTETVVGIVEFLSGPLINQLQLLNAALDWFNKFTAKRNKKPPTMTDTFARKLDALSRARERLPR